MFLRGARSFDWRALAARAARDNALSLIVARMGENAVSVPASEAGGRGGGIARGGTGEVMSLSASVLIELIYVQAASGGGVREGTVRALLILETEAHG